MFLVIKTFKYIIHVMRRDIGFLCHLRDPAGYSIELLQHQFGANFSRLHAEKFMSPERPLEQVRYYERWSKVNLILQQIGGSK